MEEENVRKVYNNIFEKYIVKREEYTTIIGGLNEIIENEKISDNKYLKVCDVLKKFVELRNEILISSKNENDIFDIELEEYKASYLKVEDFSSSGIPMSEDNNGTIARYVFGVDLLDDETYPKKPTHSSYNLQPITNIHGCEFAVMCEKILLFIKKSLETYRVEIENIYGFSYEKNKIIECKGFFSNSYCSIKECINTYLVLNNYTSRSIENLNEYYKSCFDGVSVIFDSILKLKKSIKNDNEKKQIEPEKINVEHSEILKKMEILEDQLKEQFEGKLKEKDKLIEESQRKLKEKESEIEDLKNQIEQQKKENEELKSQLERKAKELSLLIEQLNKSKQQLSANEDSISFEKPQENKQLIIKSTNLLEMIPNELKSKIEQVENFSIDSEIQKGNTEQRNMLEISNLSNFNQQTIGEDMTDSDKTNYEEVAKKIVEVVNYFNLKNGNDKKYNTIEEILELNDSSFHTLQLRLVGTEEILGYGDRIRFFYKLTALRKNYKNNKSLSDVFKLSKNSDALKDESTKETYFETNKNDDTNFESFYKKLLELPDFAESVKKDEEDNGAKTRGPIKTVVTNSTDDSNNNPNPKRVKLGVFDDKEKDNDEEEDEEKNEEESTNTNVQNVRDALVDLQNQLIEDSKKRIKNLSSLYYLVGTFGNGLNNNGDESKIGFPVAFLLNARNENNPDREGLVPMLSKLSDDFVKIINKKNDKFDPKEIIIDIMKSGIPDFNDNENDLQRIIGEYLGKKSDNPDTNKVYEENLKNNLYGFLDKIFIEQAVNIYHNNKNSIEVDNDRQAFLKNYENNVDRGRKFLQRVTVTNSTIHKNGSVVKELFNNVSSLIKVEDNNSRTFNDNAFDESCKKLNNIYDIIATGPDENKTIVKDLEVKDAKELEFSKDEQERRNQNENILEAMNHAERVRKQFKKENDNPNGKIVEIIDNDKATVITKKDNNGKETALKYPVDFSDEYIEVVKKTGNSIEVDLDQKTVNIDELDRNTWNLEKIKAIYGEQTTSVEIVTINEVNFIIPSNACDWLEINKLIGKYRGVLAGMLEYMQKISLLRVGKELNKNLSCIISVGNGKSLDNGINSGETKILTKPGLTATDGKCKGRFLKRDDELLKKSLGGVYDSVKTSLFVGATNELSNSVQNTGTQNISQSRA